MKYFIISGEASGDLHGSNLIKALKQLDADNNISAWGGDLMQNAGATVLKHYRELAFMGFVEVVRNLPTIFKNLALCKEQISSFKPDTIIFIDYPGFNLRMAKWAKQQGYRTVYYISPQVWAWKQSRVHLIKKVIDKILCILPFEKEFYAKFNCDVSFVGHPLLDAVAEYKNKSPLKKNSVPNDSIVNSAQKKRIKPVIALLPGSRKMEIEMMLAEMLMVIPSFPDYRFVIAAAPSIEKSFYDSYKTKGIDILYNQTYDLLSMAHAAVVTSGTATLETALFGVPQVVCYKGNNFSYQIAKQLIKVNYISLVNLILDEEAVKELIQHEMTAFKIAEELNKIIGSSGHRKIQLKKLKELKQKLGGSGASLKAAELIFDFTRLV